MAHILKAGTWYKKRKPLPGELDLDWLISSISPGGAYTFSNGLTESGGDVVLGGALTQEVLFNFNGGDSYINIGDVTGQGFLDVVFTGTDGYAELYLAPQSLYAEVNNGGATTYIDHIAEYISLISVPSTGLEQSMIKVSTDTILFDGSYTIPVNLSLSNGDIYGEVVGADVTNSIHLTDTSAVLQTVGTSSTYSAALNLNTTLSDFSVTDGTYTSGISFYSFFGSINIVSTYPAGSILLASTGGVVLAGSGTGTLTDVALFSTVGTENTAEIRNPSTTAVVPGLIVHRATENGVTGASGIGAQLSFKIKNSRISGIGDYTAPLVGLSYLLTDTTDGSEDGKYSLSVNVAGPETQIAEFDRYGWKNLADYSGSWTDRYLVDKAYVDAAVSDIRLKENITLLEPTLDKVNLLKPVEFDMIATKEHKSGFIAQDVQKIFEDMVIDDEGTLKIKRDGWFPILVKAVQELSARVIYLESKINKL